MSKSLLQKFSMTMYSWSGVLSCIYMCLVINCIVTWFIYRQEFSIVLCIVYTICACVTMRTFVIKETINRLPFLINRLLDQEKLCSK
jgi:hypothetical protein